MRLFISAVFLFCCLNGFGQILSPMEIWELESSRWDLGKIKGELTSVELKEYTAIDYFGELKKQSTKTDAVLLFNSNNYISSAVGFDDRVKGTINFSYKIDSVLVDIRMNVNAEVKYDLRGVWRYDSSGNITEYVYYKNDSIRLKELTKYNEKNQLIEYKSYGREGKLESIRSYKYDKNDNEIEYMYNGYWHSSKTKKNYNTSNQLIEEQYFVNDKLERSSTYKYNINGKLIEENESNEGKFVKKEATTYNTKGDKTSITNYDSKGVILNNETFIYNSEDALIEQVYTTKTSKTVVSYEYDHKGNWTKEVHYKVSPPTALPSEYTITERKITYR